MKKFDEFSKPSNTSDFSELFQILPGAARSFQDIPEVLNKTHEKNETSTKQSGLCKFDI